MLTREEVTYCLLLPLRGPHGHAARSSSASCCRILVHRRPLLRVAAVRVRYSDRVCKPTGGCHWHSLKISRVMAEAAPALTPLLLLLALLVQARVSQVKAGGSSCASVACMP
jgi:hypothetical protein